MNVELKDLAPLLLKKERAGGDIDPSQLTAIVRGGLEENERRKRMVKIAETHPVLKDRDFHYRNHTERYNFGVKKVHHFIKVVREQNITDKTEQQYLYGALGEPLPIDVHRAMFIPTLENQADEEQQRKWLPLARNFQIFGAYAQTELGHGSNVQGIETTAHYDKKTQQFIINSPTLTSRKWWPGGLGKTANYAIVHARLFLEGKDVGVQAFLVQLRSLENHEPLPGIEVGDIGPKVGFNAIDNGYCAFHNVRIPRDQMMMRYAKVQPDGTFIKPKSDKLVYLTMVNVRAYLIYKFGLVLGQVTAITTRFSAARVQGRKPDGKGEFQVLDYQNQQHALFPYIALSYAAHFAGTTMIKLHDDALAIITSGGSSFGSKLAELHAVSSGLKAWLAENVNNAIESCRRLCGGHGFSQASNLAHIFNEAVGAVTYEGTFDVLVQQHARYLVKVLVSLPYKNQPGGAAEDAAAAANTMTAFLARAKVLADPNARCEAERASDFLNFKLLVAAFETRATRAIIRLAKQFQATNNDLNECMVLMTRASLAHSELILVTSFVDGLQSIPSGATREAMKAHCALFALWLIVKSLGDFREDNYLSSAQAELVRAQLVALLPVVRKNAVLVTDAWDFSDFEMNSAIGRYDGDIYRALVERAKDEPLNKTQVAESYEAFLKPLIQSAL